MKCDCGSSKVKDSFHSDWCSSLLKVDTYTSTRSTIATFTPGHYELNPYNKVCHVVDSRDPYVNSDYLFFIPIEGTYRVDYNNLKVIWVERLS